MPRPIACLVQGLSPIPMASESSLPFSLPKSSQPTSTPAAHVSSEHAQSTANARRPCSCHPERG